MAASTKDSVAYIYKRKYTDRAVAEAAARFHPGIAMISKKGGLTGKSFEYSIRYANAQGIGGDYTTAKANVTSSEGVMFRAVTRKRIGVITIGDDDMLLSADKGAFVSLVSHETDGIIEELGDDLAFQFFRNRAVRGQRASESSDVTTLVVADDARNFKKGMTIVAGPNEDGTSLRTGSAVITSVDEDAGTIGFDTSDITSIANDDYLFRESDIGNSWEGLAALFPLTAPSASEDFRNVDRSVDPRRLAGSRLDDSASDPEVNIGLLATKIMQTGKRADCAFINPIKFWEMSQRLDAKREYDSVSATVGFEYITIMAGGGSVKVYPDPDCPTNRTYVGRKSTLEIKYAGPGAPHVIRRGNSGDPEMRSGDEDGVEVRMKSLANLLSYDPSSFGVASVG